MEDRFTKYSKLYVLVFLLFLSIPVLTGLLLAVFYGFSKLVSSRPTDIIFELLIISLPPAIFTAAYYIFSKRTKTHPSAVVRMISQAFFMIGICCSILILVWSIITYFRSGHQDVSAYQSCSLAFLAGSTGGLFLIAIIQAFTTNKEEDWMEKRKRTHKEKGL
jgi:predicted membrane protein